MANTDHASAPIAPMARHRSRGRRRTDDPSTPPSAATAIGVARARLDQRTGPSDAAPGWLAVAKTGARNARLAPARAARRKSAKRCAELVTRPLVRSGPGQRPPRKCTPARNLAASRTSPATTRTRRRTRQIRARSAPNRARSGSSSCRNTTPARPRGNRATAARGSGRRRVSVNSQSGGTRVAFAWIGRVASCGNGSPGRAGG